MLRNLRREKKNTKQNETIHEIYSTPSLIEHSIVYIDKQLTVSL